MRDGTAIVRDLAKGEQEVVELDGVVECARRMVAELADG